MQNLIKLRKLTAKDEQDFLNAVADWTDPSFSFASNFKDGMTFSEYLIVLENYELNKNLPEGRVPDTILYGFLGNKIVGRVSIRHYLNDFLERIGGHIGYGVLPKFRRRGFATEMLRQSLPIAKELGIKKALLTCNENNIASIKTIEKNKGVFADEVDVEGSDVRKLRYWIDLN